MVRIVKDILLRPIDRFSQKAETLIVSNVKCQSQPMCLDGSRTDFVIWILSFDIPRRGETH